MQRLSGYVKESVQRTLQRKCNMNNARDAGSAMINGRIMLFYSIDIPNGIDDITNESYFSEFRVRL